MRKIAYIITALASLLLFSCRQQEDTRVFSPTVEFEGTEYTAAAEGSGLDIKLSLSKPASLDFTIGLSLSGDLEEGRQFFTESHELQVRKGDSSVSTRITFAEDEIWNDESEIKITLMPGLRYTVDPAGKCVASVKVTKALTIPVISIVCLDERTVTNPFLAETFHFSLESKMAPREDIMVKIKFGGYEAGKDFLVNGSSDCLVPLAVGQMSTEFDLSIVRMDKSGIDETVVVGVEPVSGVYIAAEGSPCEIRLSDPLVDFQYLKKTAALNGGEGHQIRQAIKSADGSWTGNTALDCIESSTGSNYIRSLRNIFRTQWLCNAVSPGSNALRISDFFPELAYPNEYTIADYSANSSGRQFSACDSLFRFVLDYDSTTQGTLTTAAPRTFHCYTAKRAAWEEGENPYKAWQQDSKQTGGIIDASTSPVLEEKITVVLEKLEGRFDLKNSSETMLFTAWLRSDDPRFMRGVDLETIGAVKDGDCWKVEYKLWPR